MFTKNYFYKNLKKLQQCARGTLIDFVTPEVTAFVALPLVSVSTIPKMSDENIEKAFELRFLYLLSSSLRNNPLTFVKEFCKISFFMHHSLRGFFFRYIKKVALRESFSAYVPFLTKSHSYY